MRSAVAALVFVATPAFADPAVAVEQTLGSDAAPQLTADFKACTGEASGAPLFWAEISKGGKVTAAKVHGAGKIDACFEKALGKAKVTGTLTAATTVVGHIDLDGATAPRVSEAAVILDAHHAKWQVTATQIHYTANRMMDIAAGLDAASDAVSNCAGKRTTPGKALIWYDGKAQVRSGTKGYDDCVAKALGRIKLPAPESSFWIAADITQPGEQLAPAGTDAKASHEQALRDAINTAVRSRKLDFVDCENGHPKVALTAVTVQLAVEKLKTTKVTSSDGSIDACIKTKLDGIKIPNASPSDKLELEVDLSAL
ncbi:MAG: hypothetical protein JO257_28120 [Deltaproteobacteria bacterium]|nr:hypothetical protein [Deltaproteobacteria bacterium]